MLVTKCDICKEEMNARDTRYIKIFKMVTNHNDDSIEQVVHPELEVCVGCAEEIHETILAYKENVNASNSHRK